MVTVYVLLIFNIYGGITSIEFDSPTDCTFAQQALASNISFSRTVCVKKPIRT